jgi:ubiquinone/menaquinone biosynthesis C-methylase UbiE
MSWKTIDRAGRSLFSLNRDREYSTLCRMLALHSGDALLDVGSGDGFWSARLAPRCASVTGLEPDDKLREYAETLKSRANVTYVKGTAEQMPFADATFDKVIAISSIEHFTDPYRGLTEMVRVLKPGGRLALSADTLLPQNSTASYRDWHKQRHFVTRYFSQDQLFDMMRNAGVRAEEERTVHLFRSRAAARIRQFVTPRPKTSLPLFPLAYPVVRIADSLFNDMHGQIVIVTAVR